MSPLTIPNLLTFARIVLTVCFFSAGLQNDWRWALMCFVAAAGTDMVDGALARLLRQKSRLGAFIDPAADKLMMLAGVTILTINQTLPWWLMALIVGRDLYIVLGLFYLYHRKVSVEIRPTILSKLTTLTQIILVSLGFLVASNEAGVTLWDWLMPWIRYFSYAMWAAAVLTTLTAFQYTRIGWILLRDHLER